MFIDKVIEKSKELFPKISIKYKDQSLLMKILGKLFFFNSEFNTNYTTVLGYNIYFPNDKYLKLHPISAAVILCHELVHIYDREKLGSVLFSVLYLFPQILAPLALISWFLVGWIGLLPLLFLLPLPAIFRAYFELRGYAVSLYSMHVLNQNGYEIDLNEQSKYYQTVFTNSSYYYMFPFSLIVRPIFNGMLSEIISGKFPIKDQKLKTHIDYLLQS